MALMKQLDVIRNLKALFLDARNEKLHKYKIFFLTLKMYLRFRSFIRKQGGSMDNITRLRARATLTLLHPIHAMRHEQVARARIFAFLNSTA